MSKLEEIEGIDEIKRSIRAYLKLNEGTSEFDQSINDRSRLRARTAALNAAICRSSSACAERFSLVICSIRVSC